jgi:hypothetical protein
VGEGAPVPLTILCLAINPLPSRIPVSVSVSIACGTALTGRCPLSGLAGRSECPCSSHEARLLPELSAHPELASDKIPECVAEMAPRRIRFIDFRKRCCFCYRLEPAPTTSVGRPGTLYR